MYGVFVVITGCAQLKKIDPDFVNNLKNELDQIAQDYGFFIVEKQKYIYSYFAPSTYSESIDMTLYVMREMNNLLEQHEERLYGYTLLLDSCDDRENFDLGHWHYLVDRDNAMWIPSELGPIFEKNSVIESKGAISKITKIIINDGLGHLLKDQFYETHKFYDAVSRSLARGGGEVVHLVSPAGYGGYEISKHFWNRFYSQRTDDYSIFYLHAHGSSFDDLFPFRRALDPCILRDIVQQYNSSNDLITQRLIKWIENFDSESFLVPGDSEAQNLYSLFFLYIPVYASNLSKDWPLIVIEDVKKFGKVGIKLLKHITQIALENKLIVINLDGQYEGELESKDEDVEIIGNDIAQKFLTNNDRLYSNKYPLQTCTPLAVLLLYWNFQTYQQKTYSGKLTLNSVVQWLLKQWDDLSLELLYMIFLADGMVPYTWILDALSDQVFLRAVIKQRCKLFIDLGLICDLKTRPRLSYNFFGDIITSILRSRVPNLREQMGKVLLSQQDCYRKVSLVYLLQFFRPSHYAEQFLDVLNALLHQKVVREEDDLPQWFHYKFSVKNMSDALQKRFFYILERYKMIYHIKVFKNFVSENSEMYHSRFQSYNKLSLDKMAAHLLLQDHIVQGSRSQIVLKDQNKNVLFVMKDLVYIFQKKCDTDGECRAILEMAYLEFIAKRFRVAVDYCEIVQQISKKNKNVWYSILVKKMLGIQYFVFGDLHQALDIVLKGLEESIDYGFSRKELFFRFFLVRIFFEFGDYLGSLKQLENIEQITKLCNYDWIFPVMNCWKGRCYGHSGRFLEALEYLSMAKSYESYYYSAEVCWVFNHQEESRKIAKKMLTAFPIACNHSTNFQLEIENWSSGYSLIEGSIEKEYLGVDVLQKLSRGFSYYVLGLDCERNMAIAQFLDLCQLQEAMPDDPYSYIYSYYYMQICEDNEHRRMVYNRAVRLLNTRLNRCTGSRERKMLENGYYAKQLLMYDFCT